MAETFQALAAISAIIAMLIGIPAWIASVYYLVRTVRSTVPGNSAWRRPNSVLAYFRWQPLSPVFDSSQLTAQGLVYRRRLFVSGLLFIAPISAAFLFSALVRGG